MADSTEQRLERIEDLLAQCIREVDSLRSHIDERTAELRGDMYCIRDELRSELRSDMHGIRDELRGEIHAIRDELKQDVTSLQQRFTSLEQRVSESNEVLRGDLHEYWSNTLYREGELAVRVQRLERKLAGVPVPLGSESSKS